MKLHKLSVSLALLAVVCLHKCCAIESASSLNLDNDKWMKVSHNIEFQRNADLSMDSSTRDHATGDAINRMLSSQQSPTADSSYLYQPLDSSADYNEYQLGWYLYGFYVDCDTVKNYCSRYAMYAVYVNLDYGGGGIGEYYYYDAGKGEWICYNGGGCKSKMDCHLSDTHWKLLGVFKINNISGGDGWMEQLFKHQGICVWGEDTYKFASNMRKKMPKDCTATKQTLANGNTLYYALKPEKKGNLTLGLYTDNICSAEYTGTEGKYDVFELSGYDESYFILFNEALDTWKQCQPCISHNLNYDGFYCYDDAGYTNCNQCMKFSNKAGCTVASRKDIELAAMQKGLVAFELNGGTYGNGGVGRQDRGDTAYHELVEYDVKPMRTTQQHMSRSLPFSFAFLVIAAAFFLKQTIKNFKDYNKMKRRLLCTDEISTIKTEKLIDSKQRRKGKRSKSGNTSFDDEKSIKEDSFLPCSVPDYHLSRFVENYSEPLCFDDKNDDEVASAISRISSRITPNANFVRVFEGDDGESSNGDSNHNSRASF